MVIIHDESVYTESSTQDHLVNMDKLPDKGIPDVSHPIDDLKVSDAICDILRSHLIFRHIGSRALNALMKAKVVTPHRASLVNQVIANCASCRLNKIKANLIPGEKLHSALHPCHSIHCDEVTGLPPSPNGYTGFSLIVDRLTKFVNVKLI